MDKTKRTTLAKQGIAIAVILLIIIGGFFIKIPGVPEYRYTDLTGGASSVLTELQRYTHVEQEIPYQAEDCGVSIEFATYNRTNLGNVRVRVVGENSNFIYVNQTQNVGGFVDNAFMDFNYPEDRPTEAEKLRITITSTSQKGHGIALWCTESDVLSDYDLICDGNEQGSDLVVRSYCRSHIIAFGWPIFSLMLISMVLSIIMVFGKQLPPEKAFAFIAVSLGLIYCFVMTPMSIPDEQTHYQSALKLSNYLCFQWDNPNQAPMEYLDYHDLAGHANVSSGYLRVLNELFSRPDAERLSVAFSPKAIKARVGYPIMLLPQAIGISIGRLFRANFLLTFYFGRILNLLFFVACVYLAIKRTPRFKLLFFMIGIMPMALHQAASFSYDVFINGMALLLFAYILSVVDGAGLIQKKELLPATIIAVLLAPAKVVYAPLMLLFFLIPLKRFPNIKAYWTTIIVIGLCAFVIVLLFQLRTAFSTIAAANTTELNWEGGINYSIADIFQHPLRIAQVYFGTFRYLYMEWVLQSIGRIMSGMSMIIDDKLIRCYFLLLLLSSCHCDSGFTTTSRERAIFVIAGLIPIFLLMFIMMICWTSNTHDFIQGIQGRYFIPVVPLFYMAINNKLVRAYRPIEKPIVMMGVIVNMLILQQVLFTTMTR